MVKARIWIMDGHNMIFALHRLQSLQVSGRGDEARRGLVRSLRQFARTRGERVLVVFDGEDLPSNPGAIREGLFEAVYARRSDGEADDRIIHETRSFLEQGHRVTVVTDDVSTLAGELPEGAQHLPVQGFWVKFIEGALARVGKRVEGDFSDVEREIEALAVMPRQGPPDDGPVPSSGPAIPGRTAREVAMSERIMRKRERGRIRQERRLNRRRSE